MKTKVLLILSLFVFVVSNIYAADVKWHDNFEAAKKEAVQSDKVILVNFSGSNWCYWCKKLAGEVLDQEQFKKYAKENLVLMVADFPRPNNLPSATQVQNNNLATQFGVRGFPTIILLDSKGNMIGRTGYQEGGPERYVNHLKNMIAQSKK